MVARYKVTKFRDKWNDGYFKPQFPNPESVERQRALQETTQGIHDFHFNEWDAREDDWEEEMSRAWECYLKEEADPNYRCTCFEN